MDQPLPDGNEPAHVVLPEGTARDRGWNSAFLGVLGTLFAYLLLGTWWAVAALAATGFLVAWDSRPSRVERVVLSDRRIDVYNGDVLRVRLALDAVRRITTEFAPYGDPYLTISGSRAKVVLRINETTRPWLRIVGRHLEPRRGTVRVSRGAADALGWTDIEPKDLA